MIKVIKFKKLKGDKKKYSITFDKNGKKYTRKFGSAGMSDFTKHKDRERRERYISRHKKDLKTNDPMRPGYLSMYILWNKPTVSASLADYKRRLNTYNKTGKFPKSITGSKKLSFGAVDPCSAEALSNLPGDVQQLIKQQCAASIIQGVGKKMDPKRSLVEQLKIRGLQRYQNAAKRTRNPKENMHFINKLWTNLDPVDDFTAKWLTRASKVLIKGDFDFKTRNFWWRVIEDQIQSMSEIEEDLIPEEDLPKNDYKYYKQCQDAVFIILNKVGYPISNEDFDQFWAEESLRWWRSKRTNTFGKKKTRFGTTSIIPVKGTLLDKLPDDIIREKLQKPRSAEKIQKVIRGKNVRKDPKNMMTKKQLKYLLWKMNAEYQSPEYATEVMETRENPWFVLEPWKKETATWLFYAADILTAGDFDNDDLWYKCLEHIVILFVEEDPESRWQYLASNDVRNLVTSMENIEVLLNTIGGYIDFDEPKWYNRALYWLQNEYSTGNSFGKRNTSSGSKAPSNVMNKALYLRIKAKIRRDVNKKKRRWGAYDSGRLVREYKAKGGKYRGGKGKTNLGRWYKEKWVDACAWPKRKSCGRKTKEKIAYCRPSKKVDSKTPKLVQSLSKSQIKSRCAKKKRNPLKRVTKFGVTTPDRNLAYGDGSWTLHCSYHDWGAHSTLRYKPIARPGIGDYSYHYGIHNDGTLKFWATGRARQTPLNAYLKQKLKDYYNQYCNKIELTKQANQDFYITDQYGSNLNFGNVVDSMRKNMFNQIFSGGDVSVNIKNTIEKRCKRGFSDSFCQSIFTGLILSIYFTVVSKSKLNSNRERNIREIKNLIPSGFKPTILRINKEQHPKINEFLYLMQDHSYGNFKNARMASLTYEFINSI